MTTPLPMVAEAINAGGPVSIAWRNWLESVNRALNDGSLSVSALQALVADLQAQVAALDAGSVRQGEGIALYGSLQDTLTIALRALDDSGAGALLAVTRDDFGRVSGTKPATITGTAGRVTVADGDAVAGLPTIDLAPVPDAGGGTLLRIVRDAWGRITGTSTPTTTDLTEGANLYHTAARARAAAVADTLTDGVLDVAPSQNAVVDALAGKEPTITGGTTAQFWRGDKVWSNEFRGDMTFRSNSINNNYKKAAVTASIGSESLMGLNGYGANGSSNEVLGGTLNFRAYAAWTATDNGCDLAARLITHGTTTLAERFRVKGNGAVVGGSDNAQNLGEAALRWATVYAGTGTINTSDAREKTTPRNLTPAETACALDLARLPCVFQWLAAIAEKGDGARLHVGPTVQAVIACMEAHGLDPFRWGFVCYDEWDETPEVRNEETGEVMQERRPAGDRYSLRPSELENFIMRGIVARQDAIEARLAALEA